MSRQAPVVVRRMMQALVWPLRVLMLRSLLASVRPVHAYGIDIFDIRAVPETDRISVPVVEALRIIAATDPKTLKRIVSSTPRILILPAAADSLGQFWWEVRACALDAGHVARDPPAEIAVTLVHEMTHARLHRLGFRYTRKLRSRLENICAKAERHFALRLPTDAREDLPPAMPTFRDDAWAVRTNLQTSERLRRLGCPATVMRLWQYFLSE